MAWSQGRSYGDILSEAISRSVSALGTPQPDCQVVNYDASE